MKGKPMITIAIALIAPFGVLLALLKVADATDRNKGI